MRFFSSFAAVVMFMLVLSSCKTTPVQEYEFYESEEAALEAIKRDEQREFEAGVRKRLDLVQGLIDKSEYDDALGLLDPLKRFDFCRTEVLALEKTIEIMSRKGARAIGEKHTEVTMVTQSDTELTLPSTYGTTVMIDSQLSPIELPKGSQEDLINKKISLSLESADVAQLVEELNANGLNVIADDALQSDKTLTVKFKDVPIKELFAYIARNMGVAFYVGENMVWVTEGETGGGPKLETRIIRLPHGFVPEVPQGGGGAPGAKMGSGGNIPTEEDNDLEDVLTSFLNDSPEGAGFKIFRNRNIIVVRDTRENLRFVEELIREFDKPPMQVAIEARFITVSQKDLKDVGVELSQMQIPVDAAGNALGPLANVPNYTNRFAAEGIRALSSGATFGDVETESGMGQVTLNGVLGNRIFDVVIRMIETKRSAVSLSVPRVTVMNNRTARIRKGDKLYYFEEYDTATIDRGDQGEQQTLVPTGSPTELPVGITLDVRVNIGNNGKSILMGLKPEVVNFIQWESYSYVNSDDDDDDGDNTMAQIKLPRTHEQMVATTVGVESGETVVLGGLLENSKSKEVRKIPILGDLPLVGFLFRRTIRNVEPTNLLIFVTARVINERGEYVKVIDKEEAEAAAAAAIPAKAGTPAKPTAPAKAPAPAKPVAPAKAPAPAAPAPAKEGK